MREEIKDAVNRMTEENCKDVASTMRLKDHDKLEILKAALEDEDVAECVLIY